MPAFGPADFSPSEWDDAVLRATKFVHLLCIKLPRHLTVTDVVHTAVEQVLTGTRSFDPKRHSLAGVLCGTVRSLLSNKGPAEFRNRMPLASETEITTAVATDADEDTLFTARERDEIMSRVCELAAGDKPLLDYVEAFRANFSPEEIESLLGVRREDCYEMKRKMRTLVCRAVQEFKPADLDHLSR